jgi:hypothetical protein
MLIFVDVSFSVLISFASFRWWLACTGTSLISFEAKVLSPECRFYSIAGIQCCLSLFDSLELAADLCLLFLKYFLRSTFRFLELSFGIGFSFIYC